MSYAQEADMVARYGNNELIPLTNPDVVGATAIDANILQGALDDASAEIDSYLQSRYSLPLTTVPLTLVRHCCSIARYLLYADAAPEEVRNRYKDAVTYLTNLSKGLVNIGADPATGPGATDGPTGTTNDNNRVFNQSTLNDY
jgi:phage gp36-like protein